MQAGNGKDQPGMATLLRSAGVASRAVPESPGTACCCIPPNRQADAKAGKEAFHHIRPYPPGLRLMSLLGRRDSPCCPEPGIATPPPPAPAPSPCAPVPAARMSASTFSWVAWASLILNSCTIVRRSWTHRRWGANSGAMLSVRRWLG